MTKVRIASFNVENLTDVANAAAPLAARVSLLRPQLERLSADIICLQEVDASRAATGEPRTHSALDTLLRGTGYEDFHRASTVSAVTGDPRDRHNLVIVSRWPICHTAQYANDLVRPPEYQSTTAEPQELRASPIEWDRPLLHAEIELPTGGSLHVLNAHLRAPLAAYIEGQKSGPFSWHSVSGWAEGYFLASVKRSGQALEARMVIERMFDNEPAALIVVAGDFNAEESEVPLKILIGNVEDTGNGRLAGRSMALIEHSLPDSQRYTVIHRGNKLMLDHLLVSKQLMAHYRGIEIHNEMLGDELVAYTLVDAAPDSYHAPIVAEFDIP